MRQSNVYIYDCWQSPVTVEQRGLGDVWSSVGTGSSLVSKAAASGLLVTIGVASNVVPVVGQIASAVTLIAGYIAAARAKSKAIKNNIADIESQQKELRLQSVELDKVIGSTNAQKEDIHNQLRSLGLNGFGDWLKKTFTPGKYYEGIQADAMNEYNRIVAEVESKTGVLESAKTDLESLFDQLTGAKVKRAIIYTASGLDLLAGLYLTALQLGWLNSNTKNSKKKPLKS